MKNALLLPVVFCMYFILWTLALSFMTTLSSAEILSSLLGGSYKPFFQALYYAVLRSTPFTVLFSLASVHFYLIRHRTPLWLSFPILAVLSAVSVLVLVPLSWRLSSSASEREGAVRESVAGSLQRLHESGYIRRDSDGVRSLWYFRSPDGMQAYPVVTVDPGNRWPVLGMTVYPRGLYDRDTNALWSGTSRIVDNAGGADPYIESLAESMSFLDSFQRTIDPLLRGLRSAADRGAAYYYLQAAGLYAVLLSLVFLTRCTGWKLLNLMLILVAFSSLFLSYPLVSGGGYWNVLTSLAPIQGREFLIVPGTYGIIALALSLTVGLPQAARSRRAKAAGTAV